MFMLFTKSTPMANIKVAILVVILAAVKNSCGKVTRLYNVFHNYVDLVSLIILQGKMQLVWTRMAYKIYV